MGMPLSKIIGYLFVLAGSSGLGLWYSMQMQKRILHIKEMIRILDMVISEIHYSHSTLPECCERVGEKAVEPYGRIFSGICDGIRGDCGAGFDRISEQFLRRGLQKLPLKEEREVFIRCFSDVGYGDGWMQYQIIERGRKELQGILGTEEEDLRKRSKMAVALGTMSGILLVLILL